MIDEYRLLIRHPVAVGVPKEENALAGLRPGMRHFSTQFMTISFGRLTGPEGPPVSTTRTSPFGSTYSERGFASPVANACTFKPAGTEGVAPSSQRPWRHASAVKDTDGPGVDTDLHRAGGADRWARVRRHSTRADWRPPRGRSEWASWLIHLTRPPPGDGRPWSSRSNR